MIERLREYPSELELAQLYKEPNDANRWVEHRLRTRLTVELARERFPRRRIVADLSAGTSSTAVELAYARAVIGDLAFSPGIHYPNGVHGIGVGPVVEELGGRLEDNLRRLGAREVDLFILAETLEHVDDPAGVLSAIHRVADGLVMSTPLSEPAGINSEHVWRWDDAGVRELLEATGWRPTAYVELSYDIPAWPASPYRCQIWTAEAIR